MLSSATRPQSFHSLAPIEPIDFINGFDRRAAPDDSDVSIPVAAAAASAAVSSLCVSKIPCLGHFAPIDSALR